MVGRATGGGSVDRGDRTRGRPRPVHGVVLGAQARADVLARGAPRGARTDRPRVAHGDRGLRALDPRHRGRVRTQPSVCSSLAAPTRHRDRPHETGASRQSSARLGRRHRRPPLPAPRDDPSCAAPRRLSVRTMSSRPRRRQATSHQATACARSRRTVRTVRLRPMRCGAAVPSPRPRQKRFAISGQGVTRALSKAREEAAKCVLLCANCHAEVEGGLAQLPLRSADRPVYPA